MKYLPLDELRNSGYLFEANRQFFHPLGLVLEVQVAPDGAQTLNIRDLRDQPLGAFYATELLQEMKRYFQAQSVARQRLLRAERRITMFGAIVQPLLVLPPILGEKSATSE